MVSYKRNAVTDTWLKHPLITQANTKIRELELTPHANSDKWRELPGRLCGRQGKLSKKGSKD